MRVAYLTAQYPKTSHSFIRREIAALERLGIQVERYSVRRVDEPLVDPDDIAERGRTHVILESGPFGLVALTGLLALRRPVRWLRALRSAASMGWRSERGLLVYLIYFFEACALVPALERQGVEHLHAHFSQNGTTIARLARMLGGPTYSFTVHGPHELNVAPLLSLKGKVADAKFVAAISRYARAQVMYFSATSDWPKIAIVHCGLDRIHLAREPEPLPQAPRLVCVARFDPEKGHLVLLEALGRLAREGIAFELDLIGDGLMRPAIEQACARLGIAQRVKLSGWLGSAEVHEHLVASRIFVSTSFMEGLPVVLMEALALGRPVVATYLAGIPELVVPGENGWLVPASDVDELARALRAALTAPLAELQRMGASGRARVLAEHDVDIEARKLAELFRGSPARA